MGDREGGPPLEAGEEATWDETNYGRIGHSDACVRERLVRMGEGLVHASGAAPRIRSLSGEAAARFDDQAVTAGSSRSIDGTGTAAVSGHTFTVTQTEAVNEDEGHWGWYAAARAGSAAPQDTAGNRVAGAGCRGADGVCYQEQWEFRNAEMTAPTLLSGTIAGAAVLLHFDEALDHTETPTAGRFTAKEDGASLWAVSDVAVRARNLADDVAPQVVVNVTVLAAQAELRSVGDVAFEDLPEGVGVDGS